ncbi:MAG: hypothetical protein CFH15_00363 [Alphaproteobacteria bacterium MarineAlpha5_Bin5]|nr:MAG: hypothetical protein CFH15_00363 [Alphaproteobacteria bacterium MarineAlpha5_Bin5]PPR52703.1 MAG: hypothetical protein CFH14_00079 [Alphaproteobacteria bacterium MarineAlpha5_Bin4]|tara:strand:+ start:5234 stop:5839 length:606 start_codon:yes stop_codon:yes gene_type:complete
MLAKDTFSKKNKRKKFFFFFLIFIYTNAVFSANLKEDIINYTNSLNNFSAKFIQSNESEIVEGVIFIGEKRIKVEYTSPSKIIIILDRKKSMYFNKDLDEIEYFNTKKSEASVFFEILKNQDFLENAKIENNKNQIVVKKKYKLDKILYFVELIFEQSPYLLRKIKLKHNDIFYTISFFNHNYNENFSRNFFSLAPSIVKN